MPLSLRWVVAVPEWSAVCLVLVYFYCNVVDALTSHVTWAPGGVSCEIFTLVEVEVGAGVGAKSGDKPDSSPRAGSI